MISVFTVHSLYRHLLLLLSYLACHLTDPITSNLCWPPLIDPKQQREWTNEGCKSKGECWSECAKLLTRERVPQTTVQRLLTHTLPNSRTILIKDFLFFSRFIPGHTNDIFIFIDPVYYVFSNLNLLQFYRIHSSSCPKNSEIIWNQRKESRWRFSLASQILTFSLWNYMRSFSSGPTALRKTASLRTGSKNWSYCFNLFIFISPAF